MYGSFIKGAIAFRLSAEQLCFIGTEFETKNPTTIVVKMEESTCAMS
jgi:hypothetical protein